ncbi:ATP-binding protein [Nocardioides iriomotensis]|uniref:ATP-binding protein n=1 Tax=Nocardioides iriomotensis TaxID=715784 RepID=A0A4Q5J9N5_9ACTN|nr:ATP-binding protein [Nocardioides iriomotensis]RYU14561.1 ATP-binding protein [Nocardioides iriomotensis]
MCDLTADQFATFPDSKFSPMHARAFVREHGCPEHASAALGALLLVTTELVTNAVLHGVPPISVRLRCLGTEVHVVVGDTGEGLQVLRAAPGSPGLGLRIVADVADAWGTTPLPSGTELWCRIPTGVLPKRFGRRSSESRFGWS